MKNVIKSVVTYAGKNTYTRKDGSEGTSHKFLDCNMNPFQMHVIEPVAPDITNGTRVGITMIIDNRWDDANRKYNVRNYIKSVVPIVED